MHRVILVVGVLALTILGAGFFISDRDSEENGKPMAAQISRSFWDKIYKKKFTDIAEVNWGSRLFERKILQTKQYRTDGNKNIKFTESGFYAPSWSMPRSRLLDVNLNDTVKVKVVGIFEGEMKSSNKDCTGRCMTTERYHFSEFSIYVLDESGNAVGVTGMGSRDNIVRGNVRDKYKFTELSIENTGAEIIVIGGNGLKLSYSPDFKYVTAYGKKEENRGLYGKLDKNQKWFLGINCHVNGEGYCRLKVDNIKVSE